MAGNKEVKGKNPAFQFYPADWLRDPALRSVSSGARGLWMDILCLMWECVPRGHLQTPSGKPYTTEMICRATGNISKEEVDGWLGELEYSGVLSHTASGVIYSRRMVRDEHKRVLCSQAGKKGGGNPTFKGDPKGSPKGDSKGQSKQNANPSSSTSSSSSNLNTHTPREDEARSPPMAESFPATDPGIVCVEVDGQLLHYDDDWSRWEAKFIEMWNAASGNSKHNGSCLSAPHRNLLKARFRDPGWFWKRALAKFPLWSDTGWTPGLTWFLEERSVQSILEGRYDARKPGTKPTGLFDRGKKDDPTRVRTGETAALIEAASAKAAAKRLQQRQVGSSAD